MPTSLPVKALPALLAGWAIDWLCMLAVVVGLVFTVLSPAMPASGWSVDLQLVVVANVMLFATPLVPFRKLFVSVEPPRLRWRVLLVGAYGTVLLMFGAAGFGTWTDGALASLAFPIFALAAAVIAGGYLLVRRGVGRLLAASGPRWRRTAALAALCLFAPFYGWQTARAVSADNCIDRGGQVAEAGGCEVR